jgi:cytochrome c553
MLDHFFAISALERAVVRADTIGLRQSAADLARPRPDDPERWAPRVAELQRAARAAGRTTPGRAAASVTTILAACAGCHRDLGVRVEPVSVPRPPEGDGVAAKMREHQWGMDLFRVAVVFGDQALWSRGAEVLTSAPLDPAELAESGIINPNTIGFARRLRKLAGSAARQPRGAWLEVYRGLLDTCVGCHAE